MAEEFKNEVTLESLQEEIKKLKREKNSLDSQLRTNQLLIERYKKIQVAFDNYKLFKEKEQAILDRNIGLFLKYSPSITFLVNKIGYIVFSTDALIGALRLESFKEIYNHSISELTVEIVDRNWSVKLDQTIKETERSLKSISYFDRITFDDTKYYECEINIVPVIVDGDYDGDLVLITDNTEIINQRKKAEVASRAKGDFLANMSHEIRTPMNAIIGMTNIAMSSKSTERKEYCLDKIKEASVHLLGVINDILDMSKIEANKLETFKQSFDFEKMVIKTANVINFKVDEKKQEFLVNIDHDIHRQLISDDQRLAQVITNLLSNAVKFTPEYGKISLAITKIFESEQDLVLKIAVKDTGIGITDEQKARLFTSFEQADGSISRKFGGTGLGLAISKSIVEFLGGLITVESNQNEGSTFIFTTVLEKDFTTKPSKLVDKDVNWKNLRVLAVDDAFEIREYFLDIADALGFNCEVASDGFGACLMAEAHRKDPYHIVFIDWRMPGMNGIELANKLRDITNSALVMMISSTEWAEIQDQASNAGIVKYVPKPLFSSQIVDIINQCLGNDQIVTGDDLLFTNLIGKLEKYTILLAEDILINQEIVQSALEDTKIKIECADNGKIAYQMFANHPEKYDIIFMDIHMPEQDGYETTLKIRALDIPKAKSIPIVAMTANVFKEDVERCLAVGMNDHIGKPLDFEKIMEKLKLYLNLNKEDKQ
ncbi:MAG: response regulator [Acholeplasmatales bacterium]|jgi:signal transduction histidine kinase/CheY-like chemotaxis protein|nr:response regulator [Acholeplasmatales bacterium]